MSKIGTFVLFNVGGKLLVGQNSLSFADTITMIETSSKTTGNDSEFAAGRGKSTFSVGGIAGTSPETTDAGIWELKDAAKAGAAVEITMTEYLDQTGTTPATGAVLLTANALISKISGDFGDNAANTYSCDLQVTGATTKTVNA